MALPFVLSNGREFKSQKAAKEHFREILRAYENGRVITDPSHHDDLVALLERYDNAVTDTSSKIGTGIDHFERRINPGSGYSTPGFWVCGATYVERPYQASAFFRHFIQQERCGHMSGLSARS